MSTGPAVAATRSARPSGISIAKRIIEHWLGQTIESVMADSTGRDSGSESDRQALSLALTSASEGLVAEVPSGKTTVGTVRLPPLTFSTKSTCSGSSRG